MMTEPEDVARAKDYCTLAPDDVFGVRIGHICKAHDDDYRMGGTESERRAADEWFRDRIFGEVVAAIVPDLSIELSGGWFARQAKRVGRATRATVGYTAAYVASRGYFLGVRVGGRFFFKFAAMLMGFISGRK